MIDWAWMRAINYLELHILSFYKFNELDPLSNLAGKSPTWFFIKCSFLNAVEQDSLSEISKKPVQLWSIVPFSSLYFLWYLDCNSSCSVTWIFLRCERCYSWSSWWQQPESVAGGFIRIRKYSGEKGILSSRYYTWTFCGGEFRYIASAKRNQMLCFFSQYIQFRLRVFRLCLCYFSGPKFVKAARSVWKSVLSWQRIHDL